MSEIFNTAYCLFSSPIHNRQDGSGKLASGGFFSWWLDRAEIRLYTTHQVDNAPLVFQTRTSDTKT